MKIIKYSFKEWKESDRKISDKSVSWILLNGLIRFITFFQFTLEYP